MTAEDSHAARNAAMLHELDQAQTTALVSSHNALVTVGKTVDDALEEVSG